ncbi:hypothetical protein [Roseobacter sp. CCS2]|uniref:hypothetical protein n=1 Tax=Roseobacter sp. CCS2 TaxID=391593 RepID=UPI0012E99626|nr:hypothetical protein [Roseobacter sp. CCS2]
MKYVPHAAAISLIATQSLAGGLADAIVESPALEPEVVEAPTGSSDWIIPALIIGVLAIAVVSNDDDDDDDDDDTPPTPGPAPAPTPPPPPPP